jgi:ribonuclease HII
VGVDEAGRGPLAGPVVAAAVNIPNGFDYSGINDSKKLSSKKRELFYNIITKKCDYHIYQIDHATVDAVNILEATMMAMRYAIMGVPKADYALIDGNRLPKSLDLPAEWVVKGDAKSISIAAASILAKVTRDRIMEELHEKLPVYGFDKHKGYGTKFHKEMIKLYGPSLYHRKSFRGVKEYVGQNI